MRWNPRERGIAHKNFPGLPTSYVDRYSVHSTMFAPAALKVLSVVIGEERVMPGSDYPFPRGEKQAGNLIEIHFGLVVREKAQLCGENAQTFFALPAHETACSLLVHRGRPHGKTLYRCRRTMAVSTDK